MYEFSRRAGKNVFNDDVRRERRSEKERMREKMKTKIENKIEGEADEEQHVNRKARDGE